LTGVFVSCRTIKHSIRKLECMTISSRETRRREILEAAFEVLLELGPNKATLDDIAKRAGLAKTSLYYYFDDKKEIVREIISHEIERLVSEMRAAVMGQETSFDKMLALVKTRYAFITSRARRASREIQEEFRTLAGVFEQERERYLSSHKELVEQILREGMRRGEIRPIRDPELISLIMISSMFGCDQTFAFYGQEERVMEGMRDMLGIFFRGLRPES